jgi:hypothetical protein
VTAPTDSPRFDVVAVFAPTTYYSYPRRFAGWQMDCFSARRQNPVRHFRGARIRRGTRQLTGDNNMMRGFARLPDSTGIVYSSSRGRTIPHLPTLGLWQVTLRDGSVRRVTSGETSYMSPDISRSGSIWVSRMKLQTDICKFKPSLPKRERS